MITNFLETRRDGKLIPEGMTSVQMISLGWEPDKVLRLQWDWNGQPIELVSPYGFLSRVVRSREYLAVLEDTDATGWQSKLSVYLPDGTLRQNFINVVALPATARFPAHTEAGEFVWFETQKSPVPTAFGVVFKVNRNGATHRVDIDAATGAVLGAEEVH
jgi:hypothetical protein